MAMSRPNHSRYLVKFLLHASQILDTLTSKGEALALKDVVARSGLNKGMCFWLRYSLHVCGFIEQVGENKDRRIYEERSGRPSSTRAPRISAPTTLRPG